ncbi:DUF2975 domain-containing protein [Marinifilum fragile]|uniref:DUF2975 domain-containing protein n=1 Tax=Marinifilum fragile TaxID=570161 RepID=UPI0006CF4EFC|nr:DUF2975 domain-containing protein [Marinifilum fragile]
MKKNNRLLKHLYSTFYLFYILSVLGLAGTIVSAILTLTIGLDNTAQLDFKVMSSSVELPLKYTLIENSSFNGVESIEIMPKSFKSVGIEFKLLAFFNQFVMFLCAFLATKQLKDIFHTFSERKKMKDYFEEANYIRIRKIAFITLGYILYEFFVATVFAYFLIEDIHVMNQLIHIHPDYFMLIEIISVLIILVIAEVYKAGIKLKEESELTI